ncbi:MAG: hypothetical protein DRJ42_25665 [Deltaproteobacteria bacterium]|nr:MAG: hypothetical protein DRJ42_25665 [Deltaproteobacteria bacterium]
MRFIEYYVGEWLIPKLQVVSSNLIARSKYLAVIVALSRNLLGGVDKPRGPPSGFPYAHDVCLQGEYPVARAPSERR